MKKRKTKPQAKRNCLKCGNELSGYKRKYCNGVCQRAYEYRKSKRGGVTVSECCEAAVRDTVRGNFCKECEKPTRLATIYTAAEPPRK